MFVIARRNAVFVSYDNEQYLSSRECKIGKGKEITGQRY